MSEHTTPRSEPISRERLIAWLRTYAESGDGVPAHRDIMRHAADALAGEAPYNPDDYDMRGEVPILKATHSETVGRPRTLCSAELWDDIVEFIRDHVDVRDGTDGPRPNKAMELISRIEQGGQ